MLDVTIYMIEHTLTNTYWTNGGFKKDFGTLYRNTKTAQNQIDKGKLAMFIGHGLFDVTAEDVKISKFTLRRTE